MYRTERHGSAWYRRCRSRGESPDDLGGELALAGPERVGKPLSTADGNTRALDVNGQVLCWGNGRLGELGISLDGAIGDAVDEVGEAIRPSILDH